MFAQPVGTFHPDAAVKELERLSSSVGIEVLVIGWPLTEAGEESLSTERVQQYINRLTKRLPVLEVIKWDERYSTESARSLIRSSGRPSLRGSGRERIDTAVAGILLQEYLDETTSGSELNKPF